MAISNKNKQEVASLREKISKSKAIIFTDYSGLSANDINVLRDKMKSADAEVAVTKNTLLKVALKEEKIEATQLKTDLKGNTAVVFSYKDAVSPIKALFEFIKKIELPKVKSAIFEGQYADAKQVETISTLPSHDQLISKFIGGLKAPLFGIVGALSGVQKKFVYTISAISEKRK